MFENATLIGQIISIIAMSLIILSFQMKSNKKLLIMQMSASTLFAVSYFLLGANSGAIVNLISAVRCLLIYFLANKKSKILLIGIELSFIIACAITYAGVPTILVLLASLIDTFSMWKNSGTLIRYTRLFAVSPLWLVHNIIVFSIGGIICEIFSITSCIISFIRYKKDGFTK